MTEPYYADDLVTLYHGDCREVTEWLEADVLVTDPPYGIAWKRWANSYRVHGMVPNKTEAIAGDTSVAARDDILHHWGDRPAIVFGTWRAQRPADVKHRLIWWKQGQPSGMLRAPFMSQDEEIYILGSGFRASSPPLRSVIATTETRQGAYGAAALIGHPTPKPVGLMEVLIDRCPPGTIADPFAGSGPTLLASKNFGRRAIGVELDERYCEIAARRLAQDTLFGEVTA